MSDMYIRLVPSTQAKYPYIFEFGDASAPGMSGFYMSIMQWLKCLFTARGTDITDPAYGTDFPNLLGGSVGSDDIVRDLITTSIQAATTQVISLQGKTSLPDDTRLQSVIITQISGSFAAGYDVRVVIRNASGNVLALTVPVANV